MNSSTERPIEEETERPTTTTPPTLTTSTTTTSTTTTSLHSKRTTTTAKPTKTNTKVSLSIKIIRTFKGQWLVLSYLFRLTL